MSLPIDGSLLTVINERTFNRIRLLFAISILALACSTKSSLLDANDIRDTSVDTSAADGGADHFDINCPGTSGYCTRTPMPSCPLPLCNASTCFVSVSDAFPDGLYSCPVGYVLSVSCSNGYCGVSTVCCTVQ